jgi:acetyl esterase/lipase
MTFPQNEGAELPTLTPYPAEPGIATGAAIVVCPGGGYIRHADHEGEPVTRWLNGLGITALILRYRVAPDRHPGPLEDGLWAMRTARAQAAALGIDPGRVGILGFSAGGHLAATVATEAPAPFVDSVDGHPDQRSRLPVQSAMSYDGLPSRPDLAVLIYPVISLQDAYGHTGSRLSLLGDPPDPALCEALSADLRVTAGTPPTFLVHSIDDGAVPVENSLVMASALRKSGVAFAMQIYETGGHGYGLATPDREYGAWPAACAAWLRVRGFARGDG